MDAAAAETKRKAEAEAKRKAEAEAEAKRKAEEAKNGTLNGHDYVDLGLPSGLKWATCNVGADSPEKYGDYYAWGEVETKPSYIRGNSVTFNKSMSDISGDSTYDVARKKWGPSWRIPTRKEVEELRFKCRWEKKVLKGKNGFKVTGPNGNVIFLPLTGHMYEASLSCEENVGHYWSSTPDKDISAYILIFCNSYQRVSDMRRSVGLSVRPVSE